MPKLAKGDPAPDFTLSDQAGVDVTLSDLGGRPVAIFFYPKALTPGCTTQACSLRDAADDFKALGVQVLGISADPPDRQRRFDEKYGLGYPLLADTEHVVSEKYGVYGDRKIFGRDVLGIRRSAFVVAADGSVADAFYGISPQDTRPKIEQTLAELGT